MLLLSASSPAFAEWYVGGGLGLSIPHDITGYKQEDARGNTSLTDFSPENSFAWGVKGGYFFEKMPYFGVEFNLSSSDPDVDREEGTATLAGAPPGSFSGLTGSVSGSVSVEVDSLMSYGFLTMLRVPSEIAKSKFMGFQPFAGVGFSVNVLDIDEVSLFDVAGNLHDKDDSDKEDTSVGLLVSAGLNYIITDHMKLYSEYKYKDLGFDYEKDGVKTMFDTGESSLLFGASYNF